MKLEVRIGNLARKIEIRRTGPNQFTASGEDPTNIGSQRDGTIDAIKVAPSTYSILVNGRAFEAIVTPTAEGVQVCCGGQGFPGILSHPPTSRRRRGTVFCSGGEK